MLIKRFVALLIARNKEFYRDRQTLAWTFIFPLLVIVGFSYGYSGKPQELFKVGTLGNVSGHAEAQSFLAIHAIQFIPMPDRGVAIEKVKRQQIDFLLEESTPLHYWVNSSSPKGSVVEKLLLQSHPEAYFEKQNVDGQELRYVDWLVPGLLAMNMMFSSLFGVGYAIVRYRKNGVLKRLKATPLRAIEFLTAQIISRLILILMTSSIVFFGARLLIHFEMRGSYLQLMGFLAVGAVCMISLGLVIASRIASEELAEGLLNLLTWPMMFLSGIWFSLEGASPVILKLAKFFPLTHIVDGARAIMIDGANLGALVPQMGILATLSILFLVTSSVVFKWN